MSSVYLPHTLNDFWTIKNDHPEAVIMAGGTDLLVHKRDKGLTLPAIAGLENIPDLKQIELHNDEIIIGSMVTHQQLLDSPLVKSRLPGLHQAVAVLGSPPVRHMGTIGGNICTASPAGDTLPPLYVLNAVLELRTPSTSRLVAIQDFIQGPGQTVLNENEILYQIRISVPSPQARGFYFKVGQRKALAISITSMACLLQTAEDNETIMDCRFAWGSVGATIMRFPELEQSFNDKKLTPATLRKLGQTASRLVSPIDDVRASADYRRMLAANLPVKVLQALTPVIAEQTL